MVNKADDNFLGHPSDKRMIPLLCATEDEYDDDDDGDDHDNTVTGDVRVSIYLHRVDREVTHTDKSSRPNLLLAAPQRPLTHVRRSVGIMLASWPDSL